MQSSSFEVYTVIDSVMDNNNNNNNKGVLLHNSMSWSKRIQEVINKASKTLNFMKRTSVNHLLKLLHTTLVPILEYVCKCRIGSTPTIFNQ